MLQEVRPSEPRREIRFKRRVTLILALRELWDFRELILTLAERDLRVRYKQAVLGFTWSLIVPLLMVLGFNIFTQVTHAKTNAPSNVPYLLFAYMGLLPWTFFSSCVSPGGLILVTNESLLKRIYCPREVFPLAAMIDAAIDAAVASIVLLAFFPILGFAPKIESFYVPLLLIPLVAFSLGVMLACSVFVVYLRDLRLILPIFVQFGMFAVPVFYTPAFKSSLMQIAYSPVIDPLVPVFDGLRRTVLEGLQPNWASFGAGTASSFVVLFIGFYIFKRMETGIADVA